MTKAQAIRNALAEGPATSAELAAELGWHSQLIAAHLSAMRKRGHVTREQFSHEHSTRSLWSLVEDRHA